MTQTWGETVQAGDSRGKSPEAGTISAEKQSFGTERSAGLRRLPTQGPKYSRLCNQKALKGLKLGEIRPVLCFCKITLGDVQTCLFSHVESISQGITQALVMSVAYRKRSWEMAGARAGGRRPPGDPLFTSDFEGIVGILILDAGTGRKLLQTSRTNRRHTDKNLVIRLWE